MSGPEMRAQARRRQQAAVRRDFRQGITLAEEMDLMVEMRSPRTAIKALIVGSERAKQGKWCSCCAAPVAYCVWR